MRRCVDIILLCTGNNDAGKWYFGSENVVAYQVIQCTNRLVVQSMRIMWVHATRRAIN